MPVLLLYVSFSIVLMDMGFSHVKQYDKSVSIVVIL